MSKRGPWHHAPHPLLPEFWAPALRGDPEDTLRCEECGGYLSFEHHDAWHKIALWNEAMFERAGLDHERRFDREQRAREAVAARRPRQGPQQSLTVDGGQRRVANPT